MNKTNNKRVSNAEKKIERLVEQLGNLQTPPAPDPHTTSRQWGKVDEQAMAIERKIQTQLEIINREKAKAIRRKK